MVNGKIIVAAHKQYEMPADPVYLPVHVGAEGKESLPPYASGSGEGALQRWQPDNEGDNISTKNPGYCELTGLYWAWKNLDCDYLGLAHYRRHFSVRGMIYRRRHSPMECVLSGEDLERLTKYYSIIVPQKRRYVIETLYSHYAHTHYAEHLDITREIVVEKYPDYLEAFDAVMKQRAGYMFNMYIMKRSLSDAYCTWLFDILGELEERLKDREYSDYQGRLYGRVSEILFNVWLATRMEQIKEVGYFPIEKEDRLHKGTAFLKAKFGGKRYEQ